MQAERKSNNISPSNGPVCSSTKWAFMKPDWRFDRSQVPGSQPSGAVSNNQNPAGPPQFHHPGVGSAAAGPGGRGDAPSAAPGPGPDPAPDPERGPAARGRHSPALGLRSGRASWPAPPWGDTHAAVSPLPCSGHCPHPAPGPKSSGAPPVGAASRPVPSRPSRAALSEARGWGPGAVHSPSGRRLKAGAPRA